MNLLLDTHAFLWFLWNDSQLSPTSIKLIRDSQNRKFVSLASCWEIAIKSSVGKLRLGSPASQFLSQHLAVNNFRLISISLEHATAIENLPFRQIEALELISADKMFDQYGIKRLW